MSEILDILKSPANKLIAVDLDGTLCEGKFWKSEPSPKTEMINFVNELYKKGAHIIIMTARFPKDYEITLEWLNKFKVLFHGISMRIKIGADVYIDDKSINPNDIQKQIGDKNEAM
ncbi:unnamed protein product [marine sediment metagenome]|uniref:FCP1 homology domain-containing protein n=1 Tax=marine sediment metagenome TaxID=412755 RepID=X0YK17_9ZZZZ